MIDTSWPRRCIDMANDEPTCRIHDDYAHGASFPRMTLLNVPVNRRPGRADGGFGAWGGVVVF